MNAIGENISALRKAKELTQEDLGRAVGVSMQAVSKWENGGVPDAMLLPAIAETLGVSIDQLFGRNSAAGDVEQAIGRELSALPRTERGRRMLEVHWALQRGCMSRVRPEDGLDAYSQCFSQIEFENMLTMIQLDPEINFSFLLLEPECGYTKKLVQAEAQVKLFALLGQRDAFDLLVFLYTRDRKSPFTANYAEKQTGIPAARAEELLRVFEDYKLVDPQTLQLDEQSLTVYVANPNIALLPMLAASLQMIDRPTGFSFQSCWREDPYFAKNIRK